MWSKVLDVKFMGRIFEMSMENAQKSQKEDEKADKETWRCWEKCDWIALEKINIVFIPTSSVSEWQNFVWAEIDWEVFTMSLERVFDVTIKKSFFIQISVTFPVNGFRKMPEAFDCYLSITKHIQQMNIFNTKINKKKIKILSNVFVPQLLINQNILFHNQISFQCAMERFL